MVLSSVIMMHGVPKRLLYLFSLPGPALCRDAAQTHQQIAPALARLFFRSTLRRLTRIAVLKDVGASRAEYYALRLQLTKEDD